MTHPKTIHTARTLMFTELEKVMAFACETGAYQEGMRANVFGKKSTDGIRSTGRLLTRLYCFDLKYDPFKAFTHFWNLTETGDRRMLALLYAVSQDELLAESITVLQSVKTSQRVDPQLFEDNIEALHPNLYSDNTRKSTAQNIASSWKQAGFIQGKVRNIRIEPKITYTTAAFAFLLAYLQGLRGDFIWDAHSLKALSLPESQLRDLAKEATRKDLMQYQFAGHITSLNFDKLLNKIGIHGNTN